MAKSRHRKKKHPRRRNIDQPDRISSRADSANLAAVISKGLQAVFIGAIVLIAFWKFYIPAMESPSISQNHPRAKIVYTVIGATLFLIMEVYVLAVLRRMRDGKQITSTDQRRFVVVTWFFYFMLFFSLLPALYVAGVPQALFRFITTHFPALNQKIASLSSSIITWLVTGVFSGIAYDIIKKLSMRIIRGIAKNTK